MREPPRWYDIVILSRDEMEVWDREGAMCMAFGWTDGWIYCTNGIMDILDGSIGVVVFYFTLHCVALHVEV